MNTETFWMVYGDRQSAPTFRHPSEGAAYREAARLARAHPNVRFYVLEAVGVAAKQDVFVRRFDGTAHDDDLPF
jgi:hypothetical protein